MTREHLRKYAELLIHCVGGADGRRIVVRMEPYARELGLAVARRAYDTGALLVDFDYIDPLLDRAHVGSSQADPESRPGYLAGQYREYAGADWSLVRITGSAEPDAMDGISIDRIGAFSRAMRRIQLPMLEEVTRFRKHWVGALLPSQALARKAFPELGVDAAMERYMRAVVDVLGLNDDPVSLWRQRFTELSMRRDRFNALGILSLRLRGPGTDLTVGLHEQGKWETAEAVMPDGRRVFVNMPSLEIFTTPDFRVTSGRVAATRPFLSTSIPGTLITGAWLEFRDGAVVRCGADSGGEILSRLVELDPQARYLGEIALVDRKSAVAQSGVTFFNTLYDENAAIHIALGRGFPNLVAGCASQEPHELLATGVNHSIAHDDLMVGSGEVDVTATLRDGRTVDVMRAGSFVEI